MDDVLRLLDLQESDKPMVRTTFDRLMRQHQVKRVRRGRRGTPALFAVMDFGPPLNPLDDMSQIDAAAAVLREAGRPLSTTELVLEMKSRGYLAICGDRALAKSLGREMGRKDLFSKTQNSWQVT